MEDYIMQLIYGNEGCGHADVYYRSFKNRSFTIVDFGTESIVLEETDGEYSLIGEFSSFERAMSWLVYKCVEEENENKAGLS